MEIKTLDTLFHGTEELDVLQSIIEEGFLPSYADEKIGNRNMKVAMVSFSNIPLIEARSQVNYGHYFIGLSRDWGMKNKLHPVTYSYVKSDYEMSINSNLQETSAGSRIANFRKLAKSNIPIDFRGKPFERLSKIDLDKLDEHHSKVISEIFNSFFLQSIERLYYFKHYTVLDEEGNIKFYAYNDREWRYIPDIKPKLIFESNVNDELNPEYQKWNETPKPHFKDNPLSFKLDDINFVVTKNSAEIPTIVDTLNSKFTEEAISNRIKSGNLLVLSLEKIWNNL